MTTPIIICIVRYRRQVKVDGDMIAVDFCRIFLVAGWYGVVQGWAFEIFLSLE